MKIIFIIMLAMVLAALIAIPAVADSPTTRLSSSASIKADEFIIGLDTNPSTGYGWYASFNEKRLFLVDEWLVPKDTSWGRVGHGSTHYFLFKSVSGRRAKITFVYKRAWEETILYKKVFVIK